MDFKELYEIQGRLNAKCGIDTVSIGKNGYEHTASWLAGSNILNYITATQQELAELTDCICWKWWTNEYKYGTPYRVLDLQNARVEAVDCLHFLNSIFQLLGLSAEDVLTLYSKKLKVNDDRQDSGQYCQNKTEDSDNRKVDL